MAGTYRNILIPGEDPFFSGPFTVDPTLPVRLLPYSAEIRVKTPGLGGAASQHIRIGWDSRASGKVLGRHVTVLANSDGVVLFDDHGQASAN